MEYSEIVKRMAERIISGQESVYDPRYHIPLLLELFAGGHDIATYCARAEISEPCFRKWRKRYKAFEEAYDCAHKLAHDWWLTLARDQLGNPEFNTKIWHTMMKNRFGYTDMRKLRIRGLQKAKTFDAQYEVVKDEVSEGNLTGQEALQITSMIATGAKIHECTTVAQDVELLKEKAGVV